MRPPPRPCLLLPLLVASLTTAGAEVHKREWGYPNGFSRLGDFRKGLARGTGKPRRPGSTSGSSPTPPH